MARAHAARGSQASTHLQIGGEASGVRGAGGAAGAIAASLAAQRRLALVDRFLLVDALWGIVLGIDNLLLTGEVSQLVIIAVALALIVPGLLLRRLERATLAALWLAAVPTLAAAASILSSQDAGGLTQVYQPVLTVPWIATVLVMLIVDQRAVAWATVVLQLVAVIVPVLLVPHAADVPDTVDFLVKPVAGLLLLALVGDQVHRLCFAPAAAGSELAAKLLATKGSAVSTDAQSLPTPGEVPS